MKHGYLIKLHYPEMLITMPYVFKTMKEACYYGEYKYRNTEDLIEYYIEKCVTLSDFYKLRG